MEKNLINKLLAAGVSADVVLKLHLEDEDPKPADPDPKPADPDPKPADPDPKPADPNPATQIQGIDQVLTAINKLTGAIQAGNIIGSSRDTPAETADSILAEVLKGAKDGTEET